MMAPPYLDKSREHRRKALKIQRSLQEKDSLNPMSGSDADDVDFTKEIHPIGYFIDDRERMIEEMFSILKGEKLQRILPILLKDYTMEELKADCLVHLLGMSKKRIFAILDGKDLDSSSDSENETEETNAPEISHSRKNSSDIEISEITKNADRGESRRSKKRKLPAKEAKNPKKLSSPCIVISDDEMEDVKPLKEERRTILKLRKERRVLKAKIEKRMKRTEKRKLVSQLPAIQAIDDSNDEPEASKSESEEEDKGKSLLEILELEMRARAIRALLKNTPNADEPVPVSILNIKPEQSSGIETEINKTIAEVIDEQTPLDKPPRDLSSPTDDVEISEVNDILTVTIDDDDDIDIDLTESTEPDHGKSEEVEITAVEQKNEEAEAPTNAAPVETTAENLPTSEHTGDNVDEATVTWSERWAQSKGVTDVLKSNKLCANLRKRMRFARMLREKKSLAEHEQPVKEKDGLQEEILSNLSNVEESSVAQYELIKSLDRLKSGTEESTSDVVNVESNNTESMADEERLRPSDEAPESVPEKLPAVVEEVTENDTSDIPLPVAANEAKENCIDVQNADTLED